MHEDNIEIGPHAFDDRAPPLWVFGGHDDIAKRAEDEWERAASPRHVDQRVELETEGAPPERERLDHHRIRPGRGKGGEQHRAS